MRADGQLVDVNTGRVVVAFLETAETFWSRFWGLQFRRQLPQDAGLYLSPCGSLHTCCMRFAIDVTMLDDDGIVVAVRRNLRPWRAFLCHRSTSAVVETPAGSMLVNPGDQLRVERMLD